MPVLDSREESRKLSQKSSTPKFRSKFLVNKKIFKQKIYKILDKFRISCYTIVRCNVSYIARGEVSERFKELVLKTSDAEAP